MCGWQKAVTLAALFAALFCPAHATQPNVAKIDVLVRQLGSGNYAEREAAYKALDALGVPALDRLRSAAHSGDLEFKRRAGALIAAIEKRAENAEFLKPTLVQLNYRDIPIVEAVRDLNRQYPKRYGFPDPIVLWGVDKKRTISLTTPVLPFWEALETFCEKAELTHLLGANTFESALNYPGQPLTSAQPFMHYVVVLVDNKYLMNSKSMRQAKPRSVSTCFAGSVRIRAYPSMSATPAEGKATLTVEVMPEPKILGWYEQTEMNLTIKMDNKRQAFAKSFVLEELPEPMLHDYTPIYDFRRGQGLRLIDLPLDFRGQEFKTVKSVKGTLAVRVETADYPLLAVEDILTAGKRTFPTKDGATITMEKIKRLDDGNVLVDLSFPAWSTSTLGTSDDRIALSIDQRAFVIQLLDEKGIAFTPREMKRWEGRKMRANFQSRRKDAVASTFSIRGSHVTTIEVPFEFKDVRLR